MIRAKEHNKKISAALKGKPKSLEHRAKLSEIAKKRLSIPENNPNYKGDKVGYIGIHVWLRKYFGRPPNCEICGCIGTIKTGKWNIVYARKTGMQYKRKRENFITLCNKCHRKYDDTQKWHDSISKGKIGKKSCRKNFVMSKEAREKISMKLKGRKRPDVSIRNKILKTKNI